MRIVTILFLLFMASIAVVDICLVINCHRLEEELYESERRRLEIEKAKRTMQRLP